ncbi:MAG: carboxypeptidase-like regulatory domain-containing protein, partial [Flavobacteriaceae bacterium]
MQKKQTKIMKNLYYLLALFAFSFSLSAQQISGSVSDENGDPLPGASVVVDGTSRGVTSDFDGNFTIAASNGDKLVVSYVGYKSQTIDVGSSSTISVQMQLGSALDEVVISASRRAEKVQDAPASVSIISSEDISNSANFVDPVRSLINIPGVQVQQQSANSLNFEMRAGSGVFGTSTFPILDYRYLITPAAGLFISSQTGLSNIDIERVEVVRGAASALYGPGVTSGVVHFLSKKAIDHPGTTVELFAGTQATMGGAIRHAYANQNKTFGYKINARFSKGDEWELDPIRDAQTIEG